ncbi:hypothetical protein FISHEDRAFT_38151 [Fistulina hepatica ATCC 64428]|nr:hypothetical protein FISHEDRAFT_38151 [Fistulina hepatica ATCC 64428]
MCANHERRTEYRTNCRVAGFTFVVDRHGKHTPQVIDGRYYEICGHFDAMATYVQDCFRDNCLFSSRHMHRFGCKSQGCIRMMAPPLKNPIRRSPTRCPNCISRDRIGTLGLH